MVRNARKWLSAVLAVVMMLSMISICAFAEEAPATDVLYTEDFRVDSTELTEGVQMVIDQVPTQTAAYALSVTKNAKNSVYIYKDVDGEKGDKVATVSLHTEIGIVNLPLTKHVNDFIIALVSEDGTVWADYSLRIERNMVKVVEGTVEISEDEEGIVCYTIPYTETLMGFNVVNPLAASYKVVDLFTGEELTKVSGGYDYEVNFTDPANHLYAIEYYGDAEDPTLLTDCYYFYLERLANDKAEIESLSVAGGTVAEAEGTYTVTLPKGQTQVVVDMVVSADANVDMYNEHTGEAPAVDGTKYTVNYIGNDPVPYKVEVYAQNGDMKTYTILLTREKSAACTLLDIEGAQPVAGGYSVKIDANAYYVSAVVSPYATYELYEDAACTKAMADPFVQLKAAKTEIYVVVVAENGTDRSAPVKLTVETTATKFEQGGEDIYYQNFSNLGKVAVTGGIGIIEAEDVMAATGLNLNGRGLLYVKGSAIGKKMHFKIEALSEYEPKGVRLYADVHKTILLNNELYLTPDGTGTALYAVIEANGEKEEYLVQIISDVSYTFNDLKEGHWAKKYAEAMGARGMMKGYTDGAFKGANKLTRNEMATLMVRLVGANKELYADTTYKFQDTTAEWAVNYVKAATRIGLIDGNPVTNADGDVEGYTFNGSKNATRAEFLKVFGNSMLLHTEYDVEEYYTQFQLLIDLYVASRKFKDIESVAEWAKPYVYTAVFMGWIEGSSHPDGVYLNAGSEINRFEVAAIVARANGLA